MKPEDIHFNDWSRIFIGEVPTAFYIEIFIRVIFCFLLLLVSIRILGKRMAAQLDRIEKAALVTLAAATGVPLQAPDRGLLPTVIIAAIVVLAGRLISRKSYQSEKFEALTHGDLSVLSENGHLNIRNMERSLITKERLMAELRSEGLYHLGQTKRIYLESRGTFSIIPAEEPAPGLTVLPSWDEDFIKELTRIPGIQVCLRCGFKKQQDEQECPNCSSEDWTDAVSNEA